MILDVQDVVANPPAVDLCIVGGGPAGLTLAAALSHTGIQILLLEGGSRRTNGAAQELYRGEVIGNHPSADEYRVRALGGSSKTWGGGCVPLDPIDFVERTWVPGGRWPFGYNEMLRHYRRALVAAEAGRCEFNAPSPLIPGVDGVSFCTRLERFSRPTDFWKRWRNVLKPSRTVRVVVNANAIEIRLTAGGNRVDHIVGVALMAENSKSAHERLSYASEASKPHGCFWPRVRRLNAVLATRTVGLAAVTCAIRQA